MTQAFVKKELLLTCCQTVLGRLQAAEPGYRVCLGRPVPVSAVRRRAGCARAISAPVPLQPAVCSWRRQPPAAVCTAPWVPTSASRVTSCGHSPPPWHKGSPGTEPSRHKALCAFSSCSLHDKLASSMSPANTFQERLFKLLMLRGNIKLCYKVYSRLYKTAKCYSNKVSLGYVAGCCCSRSVYSFK